MKHISILFIYSRDIDINDSGASRTTIMLANTIANDDKFNCYTLFRIMSGKSERIHELTQVPLTAESVHQVIVEKDISILMVPEAVKYSGLARQATIGTSCKIIAALHTMPGYEGVGLFKLLSEALFYHISFVKRLRALALLVLYPLTYTYITARIKWNLHVAYANVSCLVLLSERFFMQFKKAYWLKDTEKLVAIGNPLSFTSFADDEIIKNKQKVLLVVSRLDEPIKRISYALKAWSHLHEKNDDWQLHIVGDGRSRKYYDKLVHRLKLKRVTFFGRQQPELFYRQSAIFLLTSACEGWAMTLTEAQQYGCVPIAMDSFESLHDLVSHMETGIITPYPNIKAFANQIQYLIDHSQLREQMAKQCVDSARHFESSLIIEKWFSLYQQITQMTNETQNGMS